MITGFDHIVILEGDLNEAMRRYEALGFQVERGGVHPAWGTENALIPLVNGTYLELQAARDPSRPVRHRLWQRPDGSLRESGEYGGYALTSNDLAGDVDRLKVGGPLFEEPQAGSRARPDGQMVRWRAAFPTLPTLPFLIQDESKRELRIMAARSGVGTELRLSAIAITVHDLAITVPAYERLLGVRGVNDAMDRTANIRFQAPWGMICLFQPAPTDPARRRLELIGPGISSLTLGLHQWASLTPKLTRLAKPAADGLRLDPTATGGPEILLRLDPDVQSS